MLFVLILISILAISALAAREVAVKIAWDNGSVETVKFPDTKAMIVENSTFIPVRGLFERLGYKVDWDDSERSAIISKDESYVKIYIGRSYLLADGEEIPIVAPARLIDSRTMIPIRAVSEAFGHKVDWDGDTYTVTVHEDKLYDGRYGSAGFIGDRTVIISVFVSDMNRSWDFDTEKDNAAAYELLASLETAVEWISQRASEYGVTSEFVWDWSKHQDLVYGVYFDFDSVAYCAKNHNTAADHIDYFVDEEAIKRAHNAENVIYMLFFNTPVGNPHNSQTVRNSINWSGYHEIVYIYYGADGRIVPSATVAHEILHCFGANDLYYANQYISQEYVDYTRKNNYSDIMNSTYAGKSITNSFSELDAYYIGLTDSCYDVDKWNLEKSDYVSQK